MNKSNLTKRPSVPKNADEFIAGAPDAKRTPPPAPEPARPAAVDMPVSGGRKKPISLTIEPAILAQLDRVAANLGISRASAFSLAVSRFIAQENREANK